MPYTDDDAVNAVIRVIGRSRWEAVGIAHGFAAMRAGASDEDAARSIYKHGSQTLRKARDLLNAMKSARAQNGGRTTTRRSKHAFKKILQAGHRSALGIRSPLFDPTRVVIFAS